MDSVIFCWANSTISKWVPCKNTDNVKSIKTKKKKNDFQKKFKSEERRAAFHASGLWSYAAEFHTWNREQICYVSYEVLMREIFFGVYERSEAFIHFCNSFPCNPTVGITVLDRLAHCGSGGTMRGSAPKTWIFPREPSLLRCRTTVTLENSKSGKEVLT